MELRDAFHVTLPAGCGRLTVGGLLDSVFGEDDTARQQTLGALDVAGNPDLPDMYLELLDVARLWRAGRCELRIYANNGPRVEPGHPAEDYLGHSPDGAAVLDLVLEQTFEPLAWFARQGGDCEELLRWMRACVLLYFMDKHAFELSPRPDGERDRRLLPIAEELCGRGFVTLPADGGAFAITEEGRAYLGELIAETEDYVDRYGVFGSVRVDEEAEIADFDARGGLDLRAQVYEDEGLDPLRVVFLLRLYDGALDEQPGAVAGGHSRGELLRRPASPGPRPRRGGRHGARLGDRRRTRPDRGGRGTRARASRAARRAQARARLSQGSATPRTAVSG